MEELIRELHEEYLDLNTDIMERLMSVPRDYASSSVTVDGVKVGWYQNSKGDLYNYDGLIWDVVPAEAISTLQYLG